MADWNRYLTALVLTGLFATSGPPEAVCARLVEPTKAEKRFDELVAKLGGRGTEAMMAAAALGELGDGRAVKHLLPMARGEDYSLRLAAITALGRLGDARATVTVMSALDAADAAMRAAAAEALGEIGDRMATRAVMGLLDDESGRVRLAAAAALGALEDPQAVGALAVVLGDESPGLRITAAGALGSIGRRWAEPALAKLLDDDSAAVRRAALLAIRAIGPHRPAKQPRPINPWAGMLEGKHPAGRAYAVRKLGQSGNPQAVGPLIGALKDGHVDVFFGASLWLGRLGGDEAVAALIETLKTTNSPQRWTSAAAALAERREKRAVGVLLERMTSRRFDVGVVRAGLVALGGIGDRSAVPLLRKLQESTKFRLCRATVIGVLARLGDAESWAVVLESAKAPGSASRRQAAVWLGYTASPRAVAPLVVLLSDRNVSVRVAAATSLGNIRRGGRRAAAAAVAKGLADGDRAVRRAAAKALERIKLAPRGDAGAAPGGESL